MELEDFDDCPLIACCVCGAHFALDDARFAAQRGELHGECPACGACEHSWRPVVLRLS